MLKQGYCYIPSEAIQSKEHISSERPLKFEKRVIAFVDILGFKKILQEKNGQDFLLKVLNDIRKFDSNHQIIETPLETGGVNLKVYADFCAFSDHIIISAPVKIRKHAVINSYLNSEKDKVKFVTSAIINLIIHLHVVTLSQGIALRGAIAIGEAYYNKQNNLIIGKPLVEAIESEEHLAEYPRIILAEFMLKQLKPHNVYKMDRDGLYYVDWLNPIIYQAQQNIGKEQFFIKKIIYYLKNLKNKFKVILTIIGEI